MSGILCLKWNNHTTTFIKTLDALRTKELYCDATIVCHGKYFPVHRFVLTTCSDYFEEIFDRTHCKHPFIIIKDVEQLQLEALLNYMYKGEVNVMQDKLPGLIRAAESLRVKGLAVPEDESEEGKKEKKKSSSGLSHSKSKRKAQEKKHEEKAHDTSDDEITEIETISHNSFNAKIDKQVIDKIPVVENSMDVEQNDEAETESTNDFAIENEGADSEIEDIKIEPTEIFENVEEDYQLSQEAPDTQTTFHVRKEENLFMALMSPCNTQLSEDDLRNIGEGNDHAMPQCSSWSDDLSTTSEKIPDDMKNISRMKQMQTTTAEQLRNALLRDSFLDSFTMDSGHPNDPLSLFKTPLAVPHHCLQCPFETRTKSELSKHIAYVHNEFKFVCGICQYKCRTNGMLKKHMLKHSLDKPYSCPLCTYKTARKQHLLRHNKLHTGEKPFSCSYCSYRASRKDRLREHLMKHQGGKVANVTPRSSAQRSSSRLR